MTRTRNLRRALVVIAGLAAASVTLSEIGRAHV